MTTATIEPNVPEVYQSLLRILAQLSVAKNGQLPTNMGGKPYLTAVDVARETKTLFVDEQLIILPHETITKHESIIHKDRIAVLVGVEGTYTIVSVKDGSQAVVQGAGDGLANGTAVASNIASTNALKNALLRTFLITEQSVEDAAKSGVDNSESATPKAVAAATKQTAGKPMPSPANTKIAELKVAIQAEAAAREVDYAALGNAKFESGWPTRVNDLTALLKAIKAGEVA